MTSPKLLVKFLPGGVMHAVFLLLFFMISIIIFKQRFLKNGLIGEYLLLSFSILISALSSQYFDVALFKGFFYLVGIFSLIFISNKIANLDSIDKKYCFTFFRNFNRSIALISIPIYLLGLGYPANETGFAGIINHPQAFGVFLVLSIVIELFGLKIRKFDINRNLTYIFIALYFLFSLTTESRLSIITIVVILLFYAVNNMMLKKSYIILLLISLIFSPLAFDKISERTDYILSKSGRAESSGLDALQDSRGFLVTASLKNFLDHPIIGIGFQVSNGKYGHFPMEVERDPIFDLPVKASVEKGVFWTALIEETGLLGLTGFLFFLFSFYKKLHKKISKLTILSLLLVACGESFFFSLGGIGATAWIIYFMIYGTSKSLI